MKKIIPILSAIAITTTCMAKENKNTLGPAKAENIKKVAEALPEKAPAKPAKARKILVVSRCEGFVHGSIPIGVEAIGMLGKKTGAYTIETTQEMEAFNAENLNRFDAVLFLSTTMLDPTPEQRSALLDFVRSGKGIIGIHAATDNFYQWEEGAKMMGGLFCQHPWTSGCTVQVKLDEPHHPINACFHGESFKVKDEIYQFKDPYSRQNQRIITSLDMEDPDTKAVKGGNPNAINRTDNDFGITWIRREGKGRVFYCSLGHNHHIYWDARILEHYLAGIQYALGDYEVPDVPKEALDAIRTLTPEQGQDVRRPIEAVIFNSTLEELPELEEDLLAIFKDPETTLEGKQYACRMLRLCASETSIPVLAEYLNDPGLSSFTRLVFQGLETPAADKALIQALPNVDDMLKVGIIGTLGQRGSTASVKAIKPYLKDVNMEIQRASITALGDIGGKDAAKILNKAKVAPELSLAKKQALIQCATTLEPRNAARIYKRLSKDSNPNLQAAALVGLTKNDPEKSASFVIKQLDSKEPRIQNTAVELIPALPTDDLIAAGKLNTKMSPENRAVVIDALADRSDAGIETALIQMMADTNAVVQKAAYAALGKVGETEGTKILIAAAPENKEAFNALCVLNNEGTDTAIIHTLESPNDEQTADRMLKCLALRRTRSAIPIVVLMIERPWNNSSKSAIDTFGALVQTEDFSTYAELLVNAQEDEKLKALEKTIPAAARRQPNMEACTLPLIQAFEPAEGEPQYAVLRTLGNMGGEPARELLTESLNRSDSHMKEAALRGLCSWPNIEVADQLLEQALTAKEENLQVLALRGYIRLAGTAGDFTVAFEMCQKAANATDRPEELKGIISCAKRYKNQEVLDFLTVQLDNTEVFNESAWAICEISTNGDLQIASIPALQRIVETSTDEDLTADASIKLEQYQAKQLAETGEKPPS